MKNLLDAFTLVEQQERNEEIATFEVYTLKNYLSCMGRGCYRLGMRLVGLFVAEHKEKAAALPADSLKIRHEKSTAIQGLLSEEDKRHKTKIMLCKKVRQSLSRPVSATNTPDAISAAITRAAVKVLPYRDRKGKTVTELNEALREFYLKRFVPGTMLLFRSWFFMAWVLLGVYIWGLFVEILRADVWSLLFLTAELMWCIWIRGMVARGQLAHFAWLAASETEEFSMVSGELSMSRMPQTAKERMALLMQSLHTLLEPLRTVEKYCVTLEKEIRTLEKNEETRSLAEAKKQELQTATERQNTYRQQVESLEKRIREVLQTNWTKEYKRLEWGDDFFGQLLRDFAFSDLPSVEQRLYEINHTLDPRALALPKNGKWCIPFITVQKDEARVFFSKNKKTNRYIIHSIRRDKVLSEKQLSIEALQSVLGDFIVSKEKEATAVTEAITQAEPVVKAPRIEDLMEEKQDEIEALQNRIYYGRKETDLLRQQLTNYKGSMPEYKLLQERYTKGQADTKQFEEQLAQLDRELMELERQLEE